MNNGVKKIKTIGICVARIQEDYEYNIVMAIGREAVRRGYKVLIFNTFSDMYNGNLHAKGSAGIYKLIMKEHVDGLVIMSEAIKNDEACEQIVKYADDNEIPVVTVERAIGDCINIEFDYVGAFEKIVRHVIEEHNCTKVNFIAGHKGNSFSETRLECYRRVLEDNNIPFDDTRVGYGDFWDVPTKAVMEEFLADPRGLPDAIICCNDTMALTACQMLQEHGYKIPDDVIVTGFDGIEAEKYASPRLTTAATDFLLLGSQVMDLLTTLKEKKPDKEKLNVGFMVRIAQSCGCKEIGVSEAIGKITELYNRIAHDRGHESFMSGYLTSALGCQSYKSLAKVGARHSEELNIWICLNRDYFKIKEVVDKYNGIYAEDMVMFYHAKNGSLLEFGIEYKLSEYLPDFDKIMAENDMIMFTPIHYQDRIYGYSASLVDMNYCFFDSEHRFIDNTCQILESIHKSVELNIAYSELKELHLRDSLTGLLNRRGFEEKCAELISNEENKKNELLVLSVDMDELKSINDNFGHAMGDIAITSSAEILNEFSDTSTVCARFGGDEYAIVISSPSATAKREDFIQYVRARLKDFNSTKGYPFTLDMSIGSAIAMANSMEDIHEALRIADADMYEHKRIHKQKRRQNM